MAGRSTDDDDDHERSNGSGARAGVHDSTASKKGASKKRPCPKDKHVDKLIGEEAKKRPKNHSEEPIPPIPAEANDSSTSSSKKSKKRSFPAEEEEPRKRPTFTECVQEAILRREEYKKRSPSTKDDSKETKDDSKEQSLWKKRMPMSSDFVGDGQQGTRTKQRSLVASGAEEHLGYIQGRRHVYPMLKDCIILEEKDPKTVLEEIEDLLAEAFKSCRHGKGCSFKVPLLSAKQRYVESYGWVLDSNKFITYDLSEKMMKKTVGLVCVLALIAETIKKGVSVTNRHIFYCHMEVFGTQKVSDHLIASICCMFRCTKSSLMIIAESKGVVAGPIKFVMKTANKKATDNNKKAADNNKKAADIEDENMIEDENTIQRIPDLSQVERIGLNANFMLIVEKKSILHNLVQTNLHGRYKCILISGSGYPDITTRLLIKEISLHVKKFPIFALVDPDPHGLNMLLVYKFGSKNMSYDRMGMACPSIEWLPLEVASLFKLAISDAYFSPTTETEVSMLKNILADKDNLQLEEDFEGTIKSMLEMGKKASLEAFFSLGIEHLSKVEIPRYLDDEFSQSGFPKYKVWFVPNNLEKPDAGASIPGASIPAAEADKKDKTHADKGDNETQDKEDKETHAYKDAYKETPEDKDALDFVRRHMDTERHLNATVVSIDDDLGVIDLRIGQLRAQVTRDYMHDDVIDAYGRIIVETTSKSIVSTLDVQALLNSPVKKKVEERIAQKCIGKDLVFLPFTINNNHWVLVVLNFMKSEVQILSSLAGARDLEKEKKLLNNLQGCIVKKQAIDITKWERKPYHDIPQQIDGHSCGAFVLKYMMEWDGAEMKENFTQDDVHIFKRKICSELLQSCHNKLKVGSYKDAIITEGGVIAPRHEKT